MAFLPFPLCLPRAGPEGLQSATMICTAPRELVGGYVKFLHVGLLHHLADLTMGNKRRRDDATLLSCWVGIASAQTLDSLQLALTPPNGEESRRTQDRKSVKAIRKLQLSHNRNPVEHENKDGWERIIQNMPRKM